MTLVLIGGVVSLLVGIFGTKRFIAVATRNGWSQFVRDDGPTTHHYKRGTELLMVILGGLFVMETMSVILQVGWFKATKRRNGGVGKRLFLITPIHHHFEMLGWPQVTVTLRFWIICGVCVLAGLGTFYAEWAAGA